MKSSRAKLHQRIEQALKGSPNLTDRQIARKVGTTHRTVGKIRKSIQPETSLAVDTSPAENLLAWVQNILSAEEDEITVRHLFYRLVGEGVIPKTEKAYKGLCSHLSRWRRAGKVAWDAFADNTRWHIAPQTFDSAEDALNNTQAAYRKNLWSSQPYYLEVWVEKDAMASIVSRAAESFGVPIFVCRGFASLSSLYAAAETFKQAVEHGKKVVIYHLGDHDPSGVTAVESIRKALRDDFNVNVELVRAAVTRDQIKKFKLPTRPTKDSCHSKNWNGGDSVELDAMPPAEIRALVEKCIVQHIDQRQWEQSKITEELERDHLMRMAGMYRSVKPFMEAAA
jgi:hypothetical protein